MRTPEEKSPLIAEVVRLTQALGGTIALEENERPWPGMFQAFNLNGRGVAYVLQVFVTTTETGLTVQIRDAYGLTRAQMTWIYEDSKP